MKKIYLVIERLFELLTLKATKVLGNSITFIVASCLVLFWWTHSFIICRNLHDSIGDFIFGTTFLSLFIIQKSFNRYSAQVHLKMNELISSHETANNAVINTSEKTENEILALSKEYIELEEIKEGLKISKNSKIKFQDKKDKWE
jgi:low affinity Fe/Cu permease